MTASVRTTVRTTLPAPARPASAPPDGSPRMGWPASREGVRSA